MQRFQQLNFGRRATYTEPKNHKTHTHTHTQAREAGALPVLVALLQEHVPAQRAEETAAAAGRASASASASAGGGGGDREGGGEVGAGYGMAELLTPVAGAVCNLSMNNPANRAELLRLGAAPVSTP